MSRTYFSLALSSSRISNDSSLLYIWWIFLLYFVCFSEFIIPQRDEHTAFLLSPLPSFLHHYIDYIFPKLPSPNMSLATRLFLISCSTFFNTASCSTLSILSSWNKYLNAIRHFPGAYFPLEECSPHCRSATHNPCWSFHPYQQMIWLSLYRKKKKKKKHVQKKSYSRWQAGRVSITLGALNGYSAGNSISRLKHPPLKGVSSWAMTPPKAHNEAKWKHKIGTCAANAKHHHDITLVPSLSREGQGSQADHQHKKNIKPRNTRCNRILIPVKYCDNACNYVRIYS